MWMQWVDMFQWQTWAEPQAGVQVWAGKQVLSELEAKTVWYKVSFFCPSAVWYIIRRSLREDGIDANASLFCAWTFTLMPLLLWANCFLLICSVAWAVNTGRQCLLRCKMMAGVLTLLLQGCESTGSAWQGWVPSARKSDCQWPRSHDHLPRC